MSSEKTTQKYPLNLPQTAFPIRPLSEQEDTVLLAQWEAQKLYEKTFFKNQGSEKFILHDGPPYANGHLHLGHAFNKVLKDIICKYKRMIGYHVPFTPGFDCHGLPIEFAVAKNNPGISSAQLISRCRETANSWIKIQISEFKNIGTCAYWDYPYKTMDYGYEADTMRAFSKLFSSGYIVRKEKTVPWCAHCKTVLASAEIEYEERKDPSLFVLFQLSDASAEKIYVGNKPIFILVWTTTPWTLPLNQAIIAKPDSEYVLVELEGILLLIGASRVKAIELLKKSTATIIKKINSQDFITSAIKVVNPLFHKEVPIILDQSVDTSDGTAFVHCAPGAGPDDYEIGIQNKLAIFSPVHIDGTFNDQSPVRELIGKTTQEATTYVLQLLKENGKLFFLGTIIHQFPHCWRCHLPLLFRTTKQWFCDLSHHNLKKRALDTIQKLIMIPESSKNRFSATIDGRLEWCLSRQRSWGVPIPALICTACDFAYTTKHFIDLIAEHVEKKGIEYWNTLKGEEIAESNTPCKQCGKKAWRKELDILDVWFDSGISAFAVLKTNPSLQYPAQVYCEGKDQHRGWFQSSLLLSLALSDGLQSCMQTIITHGFTVDAQGKKMSKSLGNVVSQQEMIDKISRDGLRLWVASIDYADDAVVSDKIFVSLAEVFRKIRNTCRFLLANLYDFDYEKDSVPFEKLTLIDQYALRDLLEVYYESLDAYESYNFTKVFRLVTDFCASTLSSLYLDIIKDRLYVEKDAGILRRSAQTTCFVILDTLVKLIAPIMSFTTEKIITHYQKNIESIHLQEMPTLKNLLLFFSSRYTQIFKGIDTQRLTHSHHMKDIITMVPKIVYNLQSYQDLNFIKRLRSLILKNIEIQRASGLIKHSLEASIQISIRQNELTQQDREWILFLQSLISGKKAMEEFFKELLIVSYFSFVDVLEKNDESEIVGIYIKTNRAPGVKCPRCWHWTDSKEESNLCARCQQILAQK